MFPRAEYEHGLLFFQLQSCLGCLTLRIFWPQKDTGNSGEAMWTDNSFGWVQEQDFRMFVVFMFFCLSKLCFNLYLFDEWSDPRDGVFGMG